ncbi:hypothetical protein AV521_15440 [Streptomyces sp. IMTB 2501]|uniref:S8 family serine peptidase n=1 Tax=Streptomyces sp. IMTB 2501 TaxID=1776340 RepID=UPI00096F5343|nr:S8 family serine peptidase [Streptomyces sp. IMTB 2501]OLZ70512.1 hypothetical protein AV521_15440 [Streptomyces sp. IMTB 2501]
MLGVRPIRWLLATALARVGLAVVPTTAQAHGSPGGHHRPTGERVCSRSSDPLQASCTDWVRTDLPPLASVPPNQNPPGLSPLGLRRAYDLFGQHGRGPRATASGCLRVINQRGGTTLPTTTAPDLFAGVGQAVAQGAKFASNSWVVPEASFEGTFDFHCNHPGVTFTFSSGDTGGQTQYPAASPFVTAVGGTTLTRAHNRRGFVESAWIGTGCCCSFFEPKPAIQHDAICPNSRTIADVSAVADFNTGPAVYSTSPTPSGATGRLVRGGTSVATPLVAGMYARAGNPAPGTFPHPYPYARPQDFFDITTGSTGGFSAMPGYDAPTGIGTPDGVAGLRDPGHAWHGTAGYGS